MRVTDRMIYDSAARLTGRARDEVQAATEEASSGIRVSHPGDDPTAAGQIVGHQLSRDRFAAIVSSAEVASQTLRTAFSSSSTRVPGGTQPDSMCAVATRR